MREVADPEKFVPRLNELIALLNSMVTNAVDQQQLLEMLIAWHCMQWPEDTAIIYKGMCKHVGQMLIEANPDVNIGFGKSRVRA